MNRWLGPKFLWDLQSSQFFHFILIFSFVKSIHFFKVSSSPSVWLELTTLSKSHMLYQLSQPGAPKVFTFWCDFIMDISANLKTNGNLNSFQKLSHMPHAEMVVSAYLFTKLMILYLVPRPFGSPYQGDWTACLFSIYCTPHTMLGAIKVFVTLLLEKRTKVP